jgi:hypothetical protein
MQFSYFLSNSAGLAGVTFEHGATILNYTVSHSNGDNINDLLAGLLLFTGYRNDTKYRKIIFDSFVEINTIGEQSMERTSITDEIKYIFDSEIQ